MVDNDGGAAESQDPCDDDEREAMDAADGDEVELEAEPEVPQLPQVALTFLLVSGKRRSMTFEPETTVGRTKELVWNAWPKGACDESPSLRVPCVRTGSRDALWRPRLELASLLKRTPLSHSCSSLRFFDRLAR